MANAAPNILAFGDSLTEGYGVNSTEQWVTLIQQRLHGNNYDYEIINAGISGNTTAMGKARLHKLLKQYNPKTVILALGSNDGLQGINLITIHKNLEAMLQECLQANAKVLFIGAKLPLNYGKTYRDQFEKIYSDLAAKYEVQFMPFILDGVALNTEYMQQDGLHPNAAGHKIMATNIWEELKKILQL